MIGTTNAIEQKTKKNIYLYDHLLVWFDGTDFVNHAPTSSNVTATNVNGYNQLSSQNRNDINIPMYYKAAASSYGINLSANFSFNFKDITMCAWGYRVVDTNYSNIFTIGNGSASFIELRFKEGTANNGAIKVLTTTSNLWPWQNNTWCFLTATLKDNQGKAYANGTNIATINGTNNFSTYANFRILGATCWGDTGGAAYVTDCRIYDYALTDEDILEMYNRGPQWHE